MTRVRSPNYPQLDLAEAVSRIAQVFAKDHKHAAPKEVIVQHLGYSGLNGASLSALSALEKYGLLDRDGDKYRVSDRAIAILHPRSAQEKSDALRSAARAPALFAQLLEEFPDSMPSDENLQAYLIRQGFAPSALGKVIDGFRKTMDMVGITDYNERVPIESKYIERPSTILHSPNTSFGRTPNDPEREVTKNDFKISLKLSGVEFAGEIVDREGMDRAIEALTLARTFLPATRGTSRAAESAAPDSSGDVDVEID